MGKLINSLLINQAQLVQSSITKNIYLDDEQNAHLFFQKWEAERYIRKTPNTQLQNEQFYEPKQLLSDCYALGALRVIFHENNKTEAYGLNNSRVILDFYNHTLNGAINLFKETKDVQHLRTIASCWFIVPIRINFDVSPEIVYGTVHINPNKYCFLGFSDMISYQKWDNEMVGWKPLLVNFDVMCQISKDHGYLINPKGNSLLLTTKVMEKYRKYTAMGDVAL